MWQIKGLDEELTKFAKKAKLNKREKDELRQELEIRLFQDNGDIIPGTNSAKKDRFGYKTIGTRSGGRLVYYPNRKDMILYVICLYGKSWKEDLTSAEKQAIRQWIAGGC